MYIDAQNSDAICTLMIKFCKTGWPTKHKVDESIRLYWQVRGELIL